MTQGRDEQGPGEARPASPRPAGPVPDDGGALRAEASSTPPSSAPPAGGDSATGPSGPSGVDQVEQDFDALLADTQRERDEYLDLARRTKADFENFRKRMTADVAAAAARGKAALVGELVHVIDNLERALEAAGIDPSQQDVAPEEPLAQGILLTYRDLCLALKGNGVEVFDPAGEKFDPTWHEALTTKPSEDPAGTVVETLQKGYRLGDQLIRPARVVVSE
jgi:molecular chaperone GrpE